MGMISETAATLRFFGDDLDPDEITRFLGAEPTVGVRKGESWATSLDAEKISKRGSWRLQTARRQPGDLDGQIAELFAPLTTDLSIWRDLTKRYEADVFCGVFMLEGNEGLSLSPGILEALGSRGLVLDLDVYGPLKE